MRIKVHPRSTRHDIVSQIRKAILSGRGIVLIGRYRVDVESDIDTDYVALDWKDTEGEFENYGVDLVDEGPEVCANNIYDMWVSGENLQTYRPEDGPCRCKC